MIPVSYTPINYPDHENAGLHWRARGREANGKKSCFITTANYQELTKSSRNTKIKTNSKRFVSRAPTNGRRFLGYRRASCWATKSPRKHQQKLSPTLRQQSDDFRGKQPIGAFIMDARRRSAENNCGRLGIKTNVV